MFLKKLALLTLGSVLFLGAAAEAQSFPPRDRDRGRPSRRVVDLQSPREWGRPFLAETAPDNAIINRRFPGDVWASQDAVRIRAQQVCSYYSYGALVDYQLGYIDARDYVTIGYGFRLEYASYDLVRPFQDERGRTVGYASGFQRISCNNR